MTKELCSNKECAAHPLYYDQERDSCICLNCGRCAAHTPRDLDFERFANSDHIRELRIMIRKVSTAVARLGVFEDVLKKAYDAGKKAAR